MNASTERATQLSPRADEASIPNATSASIGSPCWFSLLWDRVEVGHHLALTIAASVSETPMPQRAFSGERRCPERRLAKQGGLPDQASPNHPVPASRRRTLDVCCPARLVGFPLARFRCRRTPAGPMQSDARAECLEFLRDSSGDAPTCSDIGNLQILRRWLCQLDASEVPHFLDANRPSLWLSFGLPAHPARQRLSTTAALKLRRIELAVPHRVLQPLVPQKSGTRLEVGSTDEIKTAGMPEHVRMDFQGGEFRWQFQS